MILVQFLRRRQSPPLTVRSAVNGLDTPLGPLVTPPTDWYAPWPNEATSTAARLAVLKQNTAGLGSPFFATAQSVADAVRAVADISTDQLDATLDTATFQQDLCLCWTGVTARETLVNPGEVTASDDALTGGICQLVTLTSPLLLPADLLVVPEETLTTVTAEIDAAAAVVEAIGGPVRRRENRCW